MIDAFRLGGLALHKIFLSYSTEDLNVVEAIGAALEKHGYSCYLAERDVRPGQLVSKKIQGAIIDSDAFVVVISEHSRTSSWVQQEIGFARTRLPIVPVGVGGAKAPALLEGVEYVPFREEKLSRLGTIVERAIKEFERAPSTEEGPIPALVCAEGPYEIEPGGYVEIPLSVSAGDRVTGRIEEQDGDTFDWYIVDEVNLTKFKDSGGSDFVAVREAEDVSASTVRWTVPKSMKGPWFLLLEVYGKQLARIIHVHLRRQKSLRADPADGRLQ